jgi:hypothetical protein
MSVLRSVLRGGYVFMVEVSGSGDMLVSRDDLHSLQSPRWDLKMLSRSACIMTTIQMSHLPILLIPALARL